MALGPVMLDVESLTLSEEEQIMLSHPLVGGVIYFARNYESPSQIKALSDSIRQIRPELLIAVDQEGGRVQRFKNGFTRLPPMQKFLPLYRKNTEAALKLVKDSGWLMAAELLAVGVDFSFAPVLDLDDCGCEVIADRSFSPKPDEVIALAGAWMEGMHEAGMATTGKHFPGHGSVTTDSHLELPVDSRDIADIATKDLVPFAALLTQLDAIMPAHILFSKVDGGNSVGFSNYWLQTILREDLGFDGVIFSDDLSMEGAAASGSYMARAKLALNAGCDMILVCNNRAGALEILNGLSVDSCNDYKTDKHLSVMSAFSQHSSDILSLAELHNNSRWQLSHQLLRVLA